MKCKTYLPQRTMTIAKSNNNNNKLVLSLLMILVPPLLRLREFVDEWVPRPGQMAGGMH